MCLRFPDCMGQDESARSWLPWVGTNVIHHRLFEPEGVDQEADRGSSVACAECGPNLGRGRRGGHEVVYQEQNTFPYGYIT